MPDTPVPQPIHLVLLDFADTSRAGEHMEDHNRWIDAGFDDGGFLMTGSVPGRGGAVVVGGVDEQQVADRVAEDPFVRHGVVTAQIIPIVPSRTAETLAHLRS